MNKSTEIVVSTNDSAVLSKLSMTAKKYATDPFLPYFVSDKHHNRNRSPLINRFYYLRFKAVEYAIQRFRRSAGDWRQVISIGSGFDTTFLRNPDLSFIEIDLPFVAINKAKILIDNQLINTERHVDFQHLDHKIDGPFVALRSDNYCLIGADLRDIESIKKLFIREGFTKNVTKETRICLFNECSLCYLKQEISDEVIRALDQLYRHKCHSMTYIGFEQMKSNLINNGFQQTMLNHFQTIGSPLKTFLSKSQIFNRFKIGLNYESIEVIDMKTFFDDYLDTNEKQRINSLEMFDETEEFDSVCSSYALTIAQIISGDDYQTNVSTESVSEPKETIVCISKSFDCNTKLLRFGHSSCLTNDNKIVVFGGFGADSNDTKSHKRLSNFITIDTKCDELLNFNSCDKLNEIQRIHSKIVELKNDTFFISGGRLSPVSVMDNKIVKLCHKTQTYEIQALEDLDSVIPKVFRHLILKSMNQNKIIQIGGKVCDTNVGSADNCYYVLDTNTMKWRKELKTDLFSNIYSHSGVYLSANVFLINGGLSCDTNTFSSNNLILVDERMSSVNAIKVEPLNHLYSHHMKVYNENKLIITGGMSKTGLNNRVDILDLRSNQLLYSLDLVTESPLMLTNFSCELVLSDEKPFLWLIGGGGNCFSFGTHFNETHIVPLFL